MAGSGPEIVLLIKEPRLTSWGDRGDASPYLRGRCGVVKHDLSTVGLHTQLAGGPGPADFPNPNEGASGLDFETWEGSNASVARDHSPDVGQCPVIRPGRDDNFCVKGSSFL